MVTIIRPDSRRSQSTNYKTDCEHLSSDPKRLENTSLWKIIVRPIRNAKEKWTQWRKCHPIAAGQKKRSALKNSPRGFICLYVITNSLFCFLILLKSNARVFYEVCNLYLFEKIVWSNLEHCFYPVSWTKTVKKCKENAPYSCRECSQGSCCITIKPLDLWCCLFCKISSLLELLYLWPRHHTSTPIKSEKTYAHCCP